MILIPRSINELYSLAQKNISQSIHFKSNAAYNFLREKLGLNLPSKSSLNRWIPLKHLQPGFNDILLQKIASEINKMTDKEKESLVIFDEMVIRWDLKFDSFSDQVIGFTDNGKIKTNSLRKHICVFMIKGIFHPWKFVINYFVSQNATNGSDLCELLLENIRVATTLGLKMKAVTCDQGSNNRSCYTMLGATIDKPFFENNAEKIYDLYDVPHLIKSMRNTLNKSNICTLDGIADWKVISTLYEKDKTIFLIFATFK